MLKIINKKCRGGGGILTTRNGPALNEFHVAFILSFIVILKAVLQFKPIKLYSIYYAYNYDFGFINRSFIGTIANILSRWLDIPVQLTAYYMCVFITIVFTALLILLCFTIIRKIRLLHNDNAEIDCEKIYYLAITIMVLAFVGPIFSFYYLVQGTLDVYMLAITLVELMLIIHKRWLFMLIPLSLLGSLCYEGYFMMYFPVVFLPMLYLIFKSSGKERKKYAIVTAGAFISAFSLCFYFLYIAKSNASFEQVSQHVAEVNGAAEAGYDALVDTYMRYIAHTFDQGITYGLLANGFPSLIHITVLLWLPFALLIAVFTKKIVRISKTKTDKFLYALLFMGPLVSITVMFITQGDYDRFLFSYVVYYVFCPFILIILGSETVGVRYSRLVDYFKRKPFFGLSLSIYIILCFHNGLGIEFVGQIKNIFIYAMGLISGDVSDLNFDEALVDEPFGMTNSPSN